MKLYWDQAKLVVKRRYIDKEVTKMTWLRAFLPAIVFDERRGNGNHMELFLDSGAELSFVSLSLVPNHPLIVTPFNNLVSTLGGSVPVLGKTTLNFWAGPGGHFDQEVVVVPGEQVPTLGIDWMCHYGIVLDFHQRKVIYQGDVFPMFLKNRWGYI